MKRAILMLAAVASLGAAGCGRCDRETLTVNWTFIDGANTVQTCDASGTVSMEILVNGVAVTDDLGNTLFTCADFSNSITLFDVPIGTSDVEFDAFDVNNQFIVQQHQNVDIRSCGNTTTTMSLAMEQAPLVIDYSVPAGVCLTTDVVWYRLGLPDGTIFQVDDAHNSSFVVNCGAPIDFSPAGFGLYQLLGIEIVDPTTNPPGLIATNCNPQPPGGPADHLGFDSIPVTLGAPTLACF
jgi:hypothetical protein